jgi:hypothetical protein
VVFGARTGFVAAPGMSVGSQHAPCDAAVVQLPPRLGRSAGAAR